MISFIPSGSLKVSKLICHFYPYTQYPARRLLRLKKAELNTRPRGFVRNDSLGGPFLHESSICKRFTEKTYLRLCATREGGIGQSKNGLIVRPHSIPMIRELPKILLKDTYPCSLAAYKTKSS